MRLGATCETSSRFNSAAYSSAVSNLPIFGRLVGDWHLTLAAVEELDSRVPLKRDLLRIGAPAAAVAVLTAMGFMAANEGSTVVERPGVTAVHPDAHDQADSAATDAGMASDHVLAAFPNS